MPKRFHSEGVTPPERSPRVAKLSHATVITVLALGAGLPALSSCAPPERTEHPPNGAPLDSPERPAAPAKPEPQAPLPLSPAELKEVTRLRGLAAKASVTERLLSREALRAHLERTFEAHMPPEAISGTSTLLVALGLVPASFDYRAAVVKLMQSELAGLYDPDDDTMYLLEDLPLEMKRATLLHELVHALQDQHYSLDKVTHFAPDQTDALSAISSLAEGDATSLMFDAVLEAEHKTALDVPISILERQLVLAAQKSEADGAPPVLVRSLLAPYVDGMVFVQALRERGGFAEVDRVWKKPPVSTEQLLHLERYDARELPKAVPLPSAPEGKGAPWKLTFHDVWGEQSFRVVFEEFVDRPTAREAAEGWGGDRVATFERGAERAAALVLTMDRELDAQEVEAVFAQAGGRSPGEKTPMNPTGPRCLQLPNGSALAVARTGATLVLSAGPWTPGAGPSPSACSSSIAYNLKIQSSL